MLAHGAAVSHLEYRWKVSDGRLLVCENAQTNSWLGRTNRAATKTWWPAKPGSSREGATMRQHFYVTAHLVKQLCQQSWYNPRDNPMLPPELARGDSMVHFSNSFLAWPPQEGHFCSHCSRAWGAPPAWRHSFGHPQSSIHAARVGASHPHGTCIGNVM